MWVSPASSGSGAVTLYGYSAQHGSHAPPGVPLKSLLVIRVARGGAMCHRSRRTASLTRDPNEATVSDTVDLRSPSSMAAVIERRLVVERARIERAQRAYRVRR